MSNIPNVMKGVQLTGHGGLDKLLFRDDLPVPVPGPSDVLVKVGAAGVNINPAINYTKNTFLSWTKYAKQHAWKKSMHAS